MTTMTAHLDVATAGPLASAEAILFMLFAAGVTAMTIGAAALWFVWMAAKGLAMLTARLAVWPGQPARRRPPAPTMHACPDPVCRSANPADANFCRQCGRMLRRTDPNACCTP